MLNIHWKDWCWSWSSNTWANWCRELTYLKRPWCWERLRAGGEGDDRGLDGGMASRTQWTWIWVDSGSWWWTERPGILRFMALQRIRHNWATELNWVYLLILGWGFFNLFPWRILVSYSIQGAVTDHRLVACIQQKFTSHSSGGWKFKVKMSDGCILARALLHLQSANFSLYPHVVESRHYANSDPFPPNYLPKATF